MPVDLDHIEILNGPPVPTVLPAKGVGLFREIDGLRFFALSKFNTSDTITRMPITVGSAFKLFVNLFRA